jgi:hypothetical protein
MKRFGLIALCVFALAVLLVVSSGRGDAAPLRQGSVGTAITYQGRLLDEDNDPIQGTCAMTLTLWTAASDGSQVGNSQVFTSVAMSNGFFMVEPDFGSAAWMGEERWLQIDSACNGGAAETFDRQAVRAVPYAVHSLDATATPQPTATLVATATPQPTATLVATATPQPTATPLANVAYTNVTNVFTSSQKIAAAVSGVDGETIRFNRLEDNNRFNSIYSYSAAAGTARLSFRVHNGITATSQTEVMTLVGTGRVGIGTSSPDTSALLDLSSTTGALIVPRMTTDQRNALTATAGMIIFNTTTSTFQGYTGSTWTDL